LTGCVFTERVVAQDIDGYARLEIRGGSIGPLVLRPKQRIHFLVMAGLGPAIHAFAADRSARCECVDARHKAGHDEWLGAVSSE
jgi:hypothetical protein